MNIILRYVIKSATSFRPFPWVNELMQVFTIWIAFLAASLGVKSDSHVSLDSFVSSHMPPKVYKVVKKFAQFIVLVTLAVLIYYGIKTTIFEKRSYLQNIHLSFGWFYAAIPVGCFYLFYEYLLVFIFGKNPFVEEKKYDDEACTSGAF